jgi:hypothetical protein
VNDNAFPPIRCRLPISSEAACVAAGGIVNHTVFPDGCSRSTPQLSESMSTICSPRPLGSSGPGERIVGVPDPESVTSTRISRVEPRIVM